MAHEDVIQEREGKFVLLSHEGKVLGEHPTNAAAQAQEHAVNIAKARAAGHSVPRPDADYSDFSIDMQGAKICATSSDGKKVGWYDMNRENEHLPTAAGNSDELFGDPSYQGEGGPGAAQICWGCGEPCASECECDECPCPACEGFGCAARNEAREGMAQPQAAADALPPMEVVVAPPERGDGAEPRVTRGEKRIDFMEVLRPPERMPNGWLKCDGVFTRTGVFEYPNADGTVRREYRPPEEVFKPDSMASFGMRPVTDDHPPEFLTSENTDTYSCGMTGETVRRVGDQMVGTLLVTKGTLRKKMEAGDQVQLSNGYTLDLDWTPGVTPDGEKYDAVQRNIEGNHLAVVKYARAGPEARVRMDSRAGAVVGLGPVQSRAPEANVAGVIKIGGIDYEAGSAQAAQALQQQQERLDAKEKALEKQRADGAEALAKTQAELKKAQAEVESQRARADAAEDKAKKLKTELDAAPEAIGNRIRNRLALESSAREVLGPKYRLDGLGDRDVKLAVLKELVPDLDLKDKPDGYVDGRFDHALEEFRGDEEDNAGGGDGRQDGGRTVRTDDPREDGDPDPVEEREELLKRKDATGARERMKQHQSKQWERSLDGLGT